MAWNNSVVTNEGLAKLSDILDGGTVTISAAAIGEGTVDVSALVFQTELSERNDAVTVDIAAESNFKDGIGKTIRLQVRNTGLNAAAIARQFGIYAESNDGSTVLLAIMQDETGEEIPPEAEYPDFMLEFTAAIALSQTDGIEVTVSGSAVITAETLNGKLENYTTTAKMNEALDGKADKSTKPTVTSIVPMDGAVKLSWLPVDTATKYTVAFYNVSTGKYVVQTNTLTETEYTVTGLTNGTEYQFVVLAYVNNVWNKFTTEDHVFAIPEKINVPASVTSDGYVTTVSQTFAGAKTFNGSVYPNGATDHGIPQARKLASGTAAATTSLCPSGSWYGQHK